jgi:hypothetical protein
LRTRKKTVRWYAIFHACTYARRCGVSVTCGTLAEHRSGTNIRSVPIEVCLYLNTIL